MRLSLMMLLILSLLTAFPGQALAGDMSHCKMMMPAVGSAQNFNGNTSENSNMTHMHGQHQMSADESDMSVQMDCCDTDCQCPASACHVMNLLVPFNSLSSLSVFSDRISHFEFSALSTVPDLAFRPPIVA